MLRHRLRWPALIAVAALLVVAQSPFATEKPDFLTANIDTSVHPGDDFFQYGNGAWLKRNPMPASQSTWGVGDAVREQLYTTLRAIHERSAAAQAPAGSDDQKDRRFLAYGDGCGQGARAGHHAAAARARADRRREEPGAGARRRLHDADAGRQFVLLIRASSQDYKQSDVFSVYALQGGLGLPDRDFYFNNDKNFREIRSAYVRYLARMLRFLGRSDAEADAAAAAVMRFETALAKASRKLEDLRDPLQNYHRIAPGEFTRTQMPSVDWTERLAAWSLRPEYLVVGQPEYFAALDRDLAADAHRRCSRTTCVSDLSRPTRSF